MTKNKWKFGLLSVATVLSLAGCSHDPQSNVDYTYNTYLASSPSNWNVHNWQTSDESYITSFTEMGLYDAILNETKDGYTFVSEMAGDMPIQVDTSEVTPEEIENYYGPEFGNPEPGTIWDIPLNKNACWEDGTPITADDYIQSMELQLNPKYANFRADSYYSGNFVLANAENYYKQGRQTTEEFFKYKTANGTVKDDSGMYYLNLGKHTSFIENIFSGAEDTTLISAFNSFEQNFPTVKLACERISNAYNYYLWKAVDHSKSSHKNEWDRVTRADNVSSSMVESDNVYIELDVFNNGFKDYGTGEEDRIKTIKKLSDSSDKNFDIWQDSNVEIYTRDMLEDDLRTIVKTVYRGTEKSQKWAWKLPLFTLVYTYDGEAIKSDQIGIEKRDEYTIRFYLNKAITPLNLKFALTSNWLVKVDLYKKLTKTLSTGSYATTYAADGVDSYMSYGPYKLTYFEQGKEIKISRNEKWYGYTDGKHQGQFQMDEIDTKIYADHKTAMQEFLAGRLDDIDLTVSDVREYGQSGRCSTTYESYTQKISFNSDRSKLKSRQSDKTNKTILSNDDFRKGLSLGLNRTEFASQATSGSKAFTGLLNDLYLANNSTGESYRSTEQGQSVYGQVYGDLGGNTIGEKDANGKSIPLAESAVGYNHALAVQYIAKGLRDELKSQESDRIKPGDNIELEFRVYDDSSENTKAANEYISKTWTGLIQEAVKVLKGDGTLKESENITITVKMVKDQDYYTTARQGNYDMIFSTWGGAAVNPYGLMEVYCSASFDNICEYGFKGKQQDTKLWIDLNGDGQGEGNDANENRSFDKWYNDLNTGTEFSEAKFGDDIKEDDPDYEEYLKIHNQKLTVLAGLEAGILKRFEAVPLVARGTSSLLGFKVENATNTYVSLIGYGGIRFMKFNYTNSEWSNWCNSKNNQLGDLYKAYRN